MHIYIDESGIFNNSLGRKNVPSCVGALVIPSQNKKKVFSDFEWIKSKWGYKRREIKGSALDETQIDSVVKMLMKHNVLLEITAIDMELHSEERIDFYKQAQIAEITKSLTSEHSTEIISQAYELRDSFNSMSNSLFIQALILLHLIPRTLHHSILYFARRIPNELNRYYWAIDAKQAKVTEFEKAWSTLIYVTMSTQSVNNPVRFVEGGNYSQLERFYKYDSAQLEELKKNGINPDDVINVSLKKIFGEHLTFQDSRNNIGLQLIDILVTSTRRALKGTLSKTGWENIGTLMINKQIDGIPNGIQPIKLQLDKNDENNYFIKNSQDVFLTYLKNAKSILRNDELT